MKKFILSAFLPLLYFLYSLFPFIVPLAATAETASPIVGGYACVLSDSVYFYESKSSKRGLFLLPESYFVKILEAEETFCKVEYLYDDSNVKKLVGYAYTSELAFVDYVPRRPYLYKLFEVNYTIDDSLPADGFLNQITVTCAYYGDYRVGSETYCYVLRGDSFGYIPKPDGLTYERNTEYDENLTVDEPNESSEPSETEGGMNPAQIAILIALCLLVPILAALILKPPRRPPYVDPD